jgi:hypothetical protein
MTIPAKGPEKRMNPDEFRAQGRNKHHPKNNS